MVGVELYHRTLRRKPSSTVSDNAYSEEQSSVTLSYGDRKTVYLCEIRTSHYRLQLLLAIATVDYHTPRQSSA